MQLAAISNVPEYQELKIYRGSEFIKPFALEWSDGTPRDITGYGIELQIRRTPSGPLVASFEAVVEDAANGEFFVRLSSAASALIPCGAFPFVGASRYCWDLRLTREDGEYEVFLYGDAYVYGQVTRIP
jgi:hypothetical protein